MIIIVKFLQFEPLVVQKIQDFSSDGKITKFEYEVIDNLEDLYIEAYKSNEQNKVNIAKQRMFSEVKASIVENKHD